MRPMEYEVVQTVVADKLRAAERQRLTASVRRSRRQSGGEVAAWRVRAGHLLVDLGTRIGGYAARRPVTRAACT